MGQTTIDWSPCNGLSDLKAATSMRFELRLNNVTGRPDAKSLIVYVEDMVFYSNDVW